MSNTEYYQCENCICLMDEDNDGIIKCPHCSNKFSISDGSDYPDMDDDDYNDGYPRGFKKK